MNRPPSLELETEAGLSSPIGDGGGVVPRVLYIGGSSELSALVAHGFDLRQAFTGRLGIDSFLVEGADAIVIDADLPDSAGICRGLKTLAGEAFLPVVFLTDSAEAKEIARLLDRGDDVLRAPPSSDELAARLRARLRIRERERHLENDTRRLRTLALMDPLTELGNRRAFDHDLQQEWARAARYGRPLALLMLDIDRFKDFNDRFGHRAGDAVLRGVAATIERVVRGGDRAFRWGGEEFAVLLPDTTRAAAALVAERVREAIEVEGVGRFRVTVSIGAAASTAATRCDDLVELADRALRAAKAHGRNRVVAAVNEGA